MSAVVGIDLGTTYSAIARVNELGLPEILTNAEGEKLTPSVVMFDGESAVVGSVAREALLTEPEMVVQLIKRQMGSTWTFMHQGVEYRPEQISALILKKLVQDASDVVGPIDQTIITVPAYFNQAMRNATKVAGELAGLDVMALVNEPTAAAIAFGLQKRVQGATIVVYDLGGGTFDVTVMNVANNDLTVLATGGNSFLGGANFDKKLYDHFALRFREHFGIDVNEFDDVDLDELIRVSHEWMKRAERLKRDLTARTHAGTSLTALGKTMRVDVHRDEFEAMTRVLLDETEDTTRATLAEAHITPCDVDVVLLAGGSTRMPMVREQVERIFNRSPMMSINPDEVVVLGAALFAINRVLSDGGMVTMTEERRRYFGGLRITDVAAHSIGVRAYDRPPDEGGSLYNAIVLRKNVGLPFSASEVFFTSVPGQTSIQVDVLEGDDPDVTLCRAIGTITIDDLPGGRDAGMPVEVTMRYNNSGILQVEAIDRLTGMRAHTTIDRSGVMSDREQDHASEELRALVVE
jgi:molecular chaperone DnaK